MHGSGSRNFQAEWRKCHLTSLNCLKYRERETKEARNYFQEKFRENAKDAESKKWPQSKDQIKSVAVRPFVKNSGRFQTIHWRCDRRASKNPTTPRLTAQGRERPAAEEMLGGDNNLIHRELTQFLKELYQCLWIWQGQFTKKRGRCPHPNFP